MNDKDFEPIVLSHPVAERVSEQGLQIAELITWRFRDGLYKSPYMFNSQGRAGYYEAVALAQCAVMEVLSFESPHEWNQLNIQTSISPHWGKHPSKRKINKKPMLARELLGEQKSILLRGLDGLLSSRVVKLCLDELEIEPSMLDFDPRSGEAIDESPF